MYIYTCYIVYTYIISYWSMFWCSIVILGHMIFLSWIWLSIVYRCYRVTLSNQLFKLRLILHHFVMLCDIILSYLYINGSCSLLFIITVCHCRSWTKLVPLLKHGILFQFCDVFECRTSWFIALNWVCTCITMQICRIGADWYVHIRRGCCSNTFAISTKPREFTC